MLRLIKDNPLQAGLFLFNTGIFAWLQTTSSVILAQLGLKEPLTQYIPEPILALTGDSVAAIQAYVGNAAWAWPGVGWIDGFWLGSGGTGLLPAGLTVVVGLSG